MKARSLLLLLPSALLFLGSDDNLPTAEEILRKAADELKKHTSISYAVLYRMKFISMEDTIVVSAEGKQIRNREDTLFGGYIWFTVGDTTDMFYDLQIIYSIRHGKKEIRTFKAHEGEEFGMTGNVSGDVIRTYFLRPDDLMKLTEEEGEITVTEEEIDGRPCWKVQLIEAEEEGSEFSEGVNTIWIDQQRYTPVRKTFSVKFQGDYQYNEWNFTKITFDDVKLEDLVKRNEELLNSYTVTPFEMPKREEHEALVSGTIGPEFKGVSYAGEKEVSLQASKSKVMILDFWYMSCYPCIKAIPHLERLYTKYRDQGLDVWGINSIDNSESSRKKIPRFLEYNPMSYPIVFVERTVDSLYKVQGYPTLYVLNEKKEVIYTHPGFSENLEEKLDSVITNVLIPKDLAPSSTNY